MKNFIFAKKKIWYFEIPFIYFLLLTRIWNSWKFSTYANFGHLNPSQKWNTNAYVNTFDYGLDWYQYRKV